MRILALASALAAAVLLPAATRADNPPLVGTVGPGFTITLVDGAGRAVEHLDPGTYDLVVHDGADIHDFHLFGPGVNVSTDVEFVGDKTFTITLADGLFTFVCDPHSTAMAGTFTVGTVTSPVKTPPKTTATAKALSVRVGPGRALAFPARLAKGRYAISVRDASASDNLHLRGPGVNRRTGIAFRGTVKWTLTLTPGRYRVTSDAHPTLARTVVVR